MNIRVLDVVLSAWLTTLCIDGCLAAWVPVLAQKGQNLTFVCDAPPSTWSWRKFIPNPFSFTTSDLNAKTAKYTVADVSETDLYKGYGCEATPNSNVFQIYPISKFTINS